MSTKLSENLQLLRKEKGITQEELASILKVTSQSVSKWENSICYPDIELLPEIADFYQVSIDELLGYVSKKSINSIYIQMKELVNTFTTIEEKQDVTYRLARLATSIIWKKEEKEVNRIIAGQKSRNLSFGQQTGGLYISTENTLFITSFKDYPRYNVMTVKKVYKYLNKLCNLNTLKVLFGLFDLMCESNITNTFTLLEICEKTNLSEDAVNKAMNDLDIYFDMEEYNKTNVEKYSLEHFEQVPMLITLLVPVFSEYECSFTE